ncbi:MAG: DNA polymerase/3'-5' exonuclease PolX [Gammaproteobacteria bacterium]|nr:DNA polymerase/3'-5' exonuclease PolX [Gammaproteobacteria bacterium]
MPVHNAEVAALFQQIADLLEIENANPFRVRAYRNAARELEALGVPVAELLANGEDLTELPGIGKDLAAKIGEIVETGKCRLLTKLQRATPPSVAEMLQVPGLGPKRVRTLYHELDVHTVEQLARAARDGRVRELHGFGAKTEQRILDALAARSGQPERFKLAVAAQYAEPLRAHLAKVPGVVDVVLAGSYRRSRETVGDLDILVTARDARVVMDRFVGYDEVTQVLSRGGTRASVRLRCGIQVDLRVVDAQDFGAALLYFTGSKAHNIELRRLARQRHLKISEYGVFRGRKRVAGDTEASVYETVGLPWIAPELRENHGEIEAARAGRLPKLVELSDLRGDLHAHTRATDGHNTLREMAEAAQSRGFAYLAITEHSRRLTMAHGLDTRRLRRQIEEIDRLNETLRGFTVLKGIEVDILEDGSLDLPDEVLSELDLVVAAVHSQFHLSRTRQTQRILRAFDNPHVSILAHPTGRLLAAREPYDVDMLRVVRAARDSGCCLELNANPDRLDLIDVHCQMAHEEQVLVAISSDAHRVQDFDNLRYGVGQARRGWLEKDDVLNTRPLAKLKSLLRRRR